VNNIRADFEKELKDLRREVDFQKKLNEIQVLQSSALAEYDFEAFVKLDRYVNENNDLILAAKTATYQVKGFYISTSRFRNENFSINLPDGSTQKLKDSKASDLIQILSNQDMQTRGVAT